MQTTRRHISLRIPQDDLARIDQLARHHKLTRTDYLIRASTGQLDDPTGLQEQLDDLSFRVLCLERPPRPAV